MKWRTQYQTERAHIRVLGFMATSEDECREYFARRVAARLAENENTEALREHLVELDTTGFNLGGLVEQIPNPPAAKDWEIGEAFAEVALADRHETMFPWPTGLNKCTATAIACDKYRALLRYSGTRGYQ